MNEPHVKGIPEVNALDDAQAQEVAGGLDLCSASEIQSLTESLTQSYENLVDFTSHVIERVAGGFNSN